VLRHLDKLVVTPVAKPTPQGHGFRISHFMPDTRQWSDRDPDRATCTYPDLTVPLAFAA
jgi:hypothetical protein